MVVVGFGGVLCLLYVRSRGFLVVGVVALCFLFLFFWTACFVVFLRCHYYYVLCFVTRLHIYCFVDRITPLSTMASFFSC